MSASSFHIRLLHLDDLMVVQDLLNRFDLRYPHSSQDWIDLIKSPGTAEYPNGFCAFTFDGDLAGVALLHPKMALDGKTDRPHVVEANIWVDPKAEMAGGLREALLGCVVERSQDLVRLLPLRKAHLVFEKDPAEDQMIDLLLRSGFVHRESVFHLERDLTNPIETVLAPPGMKVVAWRMNSTEEQACYLEARNLCYPDSPLTLEEWQDFLSSISWKEVVCLAVFDGRDLAGCIILLWNEQEKGSTARTEHFFVLPRWHGLNLGRYIIAQGLQYLKKKGLREAQLDVRAVNAGMLGIYTQMGYQISRENLFLVKTL